MSNTRYLPCFFCNTHFLSVLKLDSKDEDALQAKLFLLLQTEQYEAALSLIDSFDNSSHKFEKAYALYRLQRETEAAELLSEVNQIQNTDEFYHRGVMHLEAQVVCSGRRALHIHFDLMIP